MTERKVQYTPGDRIEVVTTNERRYAAVVRGYFSMTGQPYGPFIDLSDLDFVIAQIKAICRQPALEIALSRSEALAMELD